MKTLMIYLLHTISLTYLFYLSISLMVKTRLKYALTLVVMILILFFYHQVIVLGENPSLSWKVISFIYASLEIVGWVLLLDSIIFKKLFHRKVRVEIDQD